MHFSSRLTTQGFLAIGLGVFLGGLGLPVLHAQDCPKKTCPAPVVLEKPQVPATCCPTVVLEKPQLPPAETCCPVDPKEVEKSQKDAEHAQHEVAEACRKQQKAIERAQQKLDEELAEQQAKIDKANAHLEHE